MACFLSGYELCLSFASLFNCDERTEEFFKNYGIHIKIYELANKFMSNDGFSAFNEALKTFSSDSGEYISIVMLWPAIIAVTEIICTIATEQHNKAEIIQLSNTLLKRLWTTNQSEIEILTKDRHKLNKFFKNLKSILQISIGKAEVEQLFEKLKVKFSILSALPNTLNITNNLTTTKEDLQDEESLKYAIEVLKTQLDECKEKLDTILSNKSVAKALKEKDQWLIPDKNSDKQEANLLEELKTLIQNDQIDEAKKLIRWKKTILALAEYSGWELAGMIKKYTHSSMTIRATDIIKV